MLFSVREKSGGMFGESQDSPREVRGKTSWERGGKDPEEMERGLLDPSTERKLKYSEIQRPE